MRIVDLSRTSSAFHESAKLVPKGAEARVHDIAFGTRMESPSLLFGNDKKISELDSRIFLSQAVLLDLAHKKAGEIIDDEDLEAAEERAGLALRENEFAVLRTGWGENINAAVGNLYISLSQNGAEYLEFKGAVGVGIDTPNLDPPSEPSLPAHSVLLRRGILVLEGLCNLEKIEEPRFRLVALPLKVDASVAPARAIGIVEDTA